MKTHVGVEL